MKTRFVIPLVLCLGCLGILLTQPEVAPAKQDSATSQAAVVHLSHFTDDLHRASMGLKIANLMQENGVATTLFLDIEGARIGDTRQSLDVVWGASDTTLAKLYNDFVANGGVVVVCPHCAKAAGLDAQHLRKGAIIATQGDIVDLFVTADKVVDY
ncbi:signal peptide-domain containing protein [Bremerella cremea]|uniref:Signal peptide-domain containing protein n=1 Tax=Bremerella cremea TaxID=1031537 RepID=A0A368KW06_9BACT|nr:DsrE family protein [Bremerella cremea]RCS54623.1 signal peptide-domain containing protein [Bremerella cremea]